MQSAVTPQTVTAAQGSISSVEAAHRAKDMGISVFYDALVSTGLAHTIACDNAQNIIFTCFAPIDDTMMEVRCALGLRSAPPLPPFPSPRH